MKAQINSLRFEGIKDILDVKKFSTVYDKECFFSIAKTFDKYGKLDKYLITLLHTHFEIKDNEFLMEFRSNDKRVVEKTPMMVSNYSDNLVPTSWRLFTNKIGYSDNIPSNTIAIEYSTKDITGGPFQFDETDELCFTEVADILTRYGNIDRFGLSLNYTNLVMESNEASLESTFIESRINHIEPKLESEIDKEKSIQTSWKLNNEIIKAITRCDSEYARWCESWCSTKSWCDGNEYYHNSEEKHTGSRHTKKSSSPVHYVRN